MGAPTENRIGADLLIWGQLTVVAAYGYALVAWVATDAEFFPEHAPPAWSWPAVIAVGIGFVPAVLCLLLAVPVLGSLRDGPDPSRRRRLVAANAGSVAMLATMASPLGWELFDWYVS